MLRLEDIKAGSFIKGIAGNEIAEIIAVRDHGEAINVFYQIGSACSSVMLYRSDEERLSGADNHLVWNFQADGNALKLALEAYRIKLAYLFDPYLAVHTSEIEPLPHQIMAVYQDMLNKMPLRFLLADDPGAGKTIMTGLLIKELILRDDLKRCLIISPGSLAEQWQEELSRKFDLKFEILTREKVKEAAVKGQNIFNELNFCIARLDKLSRDESLQSNLEAVDWDLTVIDEAHKLSVNVTGDEVHYTKRFKLGALAAKKSQHLLLLTATPHNGHDKEFQVFMSLTDPDRYDGAGHADKPVDVSDVMRRLVKEDLVTFDGKPLFPERRACTVSYNLSPSEAELYNQVTDYVRNEFNRADRLDNNHKNMVGFALTILQRRLASSPEAIYQSLKSRRERLEINLNELKRNEREDFNFNFNNDLDDYNNDELKLGDAEVLENKAASRASASRSIHELEAEINKLRELEYKANKVRNSGEDAKWNQLSMLLQEDEQLKNEKLIIFTEHKDTLNYLYNKISSMLGSNKAVVVIQGGLSRDERVRAESKFKNDADARILIATDAAGEGINLQSAHLMVNYDLPWNPNRLEQRFGRIHRIGQTKVCNLWNLLANNTREGDVFLTLFEKLEKVREALGGKVFDVLGDLKFDNEPLRDLLIKAIRYGNDPEARKKFNATVENSFDINHLKNLLELNALNKNNLDMSEIINIKSNMERMEASKLQPYFISAFFAEALNQLGGTCQPCETGSLIKQGIYKISKVPAAIKARYNNINKKYERICFDKQALQSSKLKGAQIEFITPSHPLLKAVIDLTLEKSKDLMKTGAVLIDENDFSFNARLLFNIQTEIQDGTHKVIYQDMNFVELLESGETISSGNAPYLNYRAASLNERNAVLDYAKNKAWLADNNIENAAINFAVKNIIPNNLDKVKSRRLEELDKISMAIVTRLTSEIQYWNNKAEELRERENSSKSRIRNNLTSNNALERAAEREARLNSRLDKLNLERSISAMPPKIIGGALIIPAGLLSKLTGSDNQALFHDGDKKSIELAAMQAVMRAEREQGCKAKDVSKDKLGYDVESKGSGNLLRLIEVKGRAKGTLTVTVTANEIRMALNSPDNFILAFAEVEFIYNANVKSCVCKLVYLKRPFQSAPDFTAASVNYNINNLINKAEIIYKKTFKLY